MRISFFRQSVLIKRSGEKTERGSTVQDWDGARLILVERCSVQPGTTELDRDGRVLGVADGLTAYLPAETDVRASDRIVYDSKEYTILGQPQKWRSPTGRLDHLKLSLRRWQG